MNHQSEIEKVAEECIKTFSERAQVLKAVEELNELCVELFRFLNTRNDDYEDLASEMADVEFMLLQMRVLFDNKTRDLFSKRVEEIKSYKIGRVKGRIEEYKKHMGD